MENVGLLWFLYVIVPVLGFIATIYLSNRAEKKKVE
ncbi:hypothetical protein J2S17_001464 [Cytobacillus purgationiresistens]|uniref:Uncharacterized protein n=1 Tax=Cytobacillus purgationiresistens TaxID=863449 RepID=A0ABU0AEB7_9BACI|nr:hypothetical protein [Cytobacillus purgationiresistens]